MTSSSLFQLVIFDFDGTLIDSKQDIESSVRTTFREFALKDVSPEEIDKNIGIGIEPLIKEALKTSPEKHDLEDVLTFFRNHYKVNLLVQTNFYPGVVTGLQSLSGIRLGILSNKREIFVKRILSGLAQNHLFTYVFGGDSFPQKKPDPCAVLSMISDSDVPKESVLIVGDAGVDIETGKRAGIRTCGVSYGYREREELQKSGADVILDSFDEVVRFIKGGIY